MSHAKIFLNCNGNVIFSGQSRPDIAPHSLLPALLCIINFMLRLGVFEWPLSPVSLGPAVPADPFVSPDSATLVVPGLKGTGQERIQRGFAVVFPSRLSVLGEIFHPVRANLPTSLRHTSTLSTRYHAKLSALAKPFRRKRVRGRAQLLT